MKKSSNSVLLFCLLSAGVFLKAQNNGAQPSPVPATAPDTQTPAKASTAQTDSQNSMAAPTPAAPLPAPGDPLFAPIATTHSQTLHEKFIDYAVVTTGPRALFTPAISAAFRMANPPKTYPHDWKDGGEAFGKNYGDALARTSAMQTGRFIASAVLHEDFRYRPSTSKNPVARTFHAVGYTFFDKSDSGHTRLAFANFAGAASEGFIGNLYLPRGYNNVSHAESRMAVTFGTFAAKNVAREFAPELLKASHALHLPFPRIPIPEWWISH
jgi:hypothetical protein